MSSISVAISYLFCEIDCRDDMWQNHLANIVKYSLGDNSYSS